MRTIHKFNDFRVELLGANNVSHGLWLGLQLARQEGNSPVKLKHVALYYLLCPFVRQHRKYRLFLDYEAKNKYRMVLSCLDPPACEYEIRPADSSDAAIYRDFVFDELLSDHLDFMLDFDQIRHEWSSLGTYFNKYLSLNEKGLHACRNLRIYSYYVENHIDGETVRSLFGYKSFPFKMDREKAIAKLTSRALPTM